MIYNKAMRLKGSTRPEQQKMIASMMIMAKKMGVFSRDGGGGCGCGGGWVG